MANEPRILPATGSGSDALPAQPLARFAFANGPRFDGACPSSPAAAIQSAKAAGTFGTIAIRVGIPWDEEPWGWSCGFYPGSHPGECTNGTAATFDQARADFVSAWGAFLSKRTEADFQAWRHQRDWTARKYAIWDRGGRMPSQKSSSLMKCPCGEVFDSHRLEHTLVHVPHITTTVDNETYH
jgi:hypothetical protein